MIFAKKLPFIVFLCAVCVLVSSLALAAVEGGNEEHGRALAIEKCKHCHIQGAEAGTMTPLSKTQHQWERFFNKRRHNKIAPGAWDSLSETDLKDVLQFVYDHAADSDQPSTFGE